ncbi:ABC-2 type transport system permease protein [Kitasatospora sp. MAA19]|uniref:ABC transporter permease subunit n=1 Tax=unclassified Kitasatospora TaxID=2633591 RepID=UPI002473DB44|nr:ABC transporter permease subunit [Kitasatospora sp. MAA19]MDH6707854.1 ABC-2 type transport system permease protein [Kitasatospora sp. MAA19]
MTTPTLTTATPSTGIGAAPRTRLRDLLAAEWIKLWSLRSTAWVLGLSALFVIAANLKSARYTYDHYTVGEGDPTTMLQVALGDSFTVIAADVVMIVAGSVGALAVVGEYASGLIRTTLVAVPDRRAVITAKACVLTVVMLGYGVLTAGVSFVACQAVLADTHIGLSLAHPAALRFVAAAALFAPVCALAGFALGALIRHTAGAVVSTVLVLFFLPAFFNERYRWSADLLHAMPLQAWRRLSQVDLTHTLPVAHPATVAGSWATYAAWALASVAVAVAVVHRRDH